MMHESKEPRTWRTRCWNPGPESVCNVRAVAGVAYRPGVRQDGEVDYDVMEETRRVEAEAIHKGLEASVLSCR